MSDLGKSEEVRRVPYPGTEGAPTDSPHDMSHMVQIDTMIADLQKISTSFGNTCVYVRRGGLSWGAVALNRRDEDEKFGLFDLQARHDRELIRHAGQVERLIESRNEQYEERGKAEAEIERLRAENERLTGRVAEYEAVWNDSSAMHVNLLRARILSRDQALHLAGATDYDHLKARADTATRALSDLRARIANPTNEIVERGARALCLRDCLNDFSGDAVADKCPYSEGCDDDWASWTPFVRAVLSALSKDLTADKEGEDND